MPKPRTGARPKRGTQNELVRVRAQLGLASHIGVVDDTLLAGTLRDDASWDQPEGHTMCRAK